MSASITVRVPITIRKRGGRRLVVAPDGAPWSVPRGRVDNTLVKALARAHRWKKMLDDGRYRTVNELAAGEKLDRGYLGKILMLTLLAPDVVKAILDGRQPEGMTLPGLLVGVEVVWQGQRIRDAACLLPPRLAGGMSGLINASSASVPKPT